ncbi:MAG: aldo/keto reductase, partial [Betaproteobacteria bacterium]
MPVLTAWSTPGAALLVTAGAGVPMAEAHGVSLATVALAWVMRHPSRPRPITGSGRLEALAEAVAATRLVLDREAWTSVWRASMGHDVP